MLAIAGTVVVVLLMASGRVGYFDDELYFLAAGRHLAWGYADQSPLVPLLARAMDSLIPGSLVAERLPVTILTAAGVMLTALIARELGGQRQPIGTGTRQPSTGSGQHADGRAPTAPPRLLVLRVTPGRHRHCPVRRLQPGLSTPVLHRSKRVHHHHLWPCHEPVRTSRTGLALLWAA